ncbi:MAG: 4-(cytidine 5'-diphospho)-2-C-methyl-D-erythritol kinase [Geminicoccaceae bacterium]|nr:4-(cytidine 5'-diphospho)-2-C-methyl-D-erythritol kinase [Geminicoccaceae bacterium]
MARAGDDTTGDDPAGDDAAPDRVIEERAPAKVNLDLRVTARRADGYHDLDSLVVFTELADRLTLRRADSWSLETGGPFAAGLPAVEDDLVWRAAQRLHRYAPDRPPVSIRLTKNLPVAGGIGGGSADAAAVLRGLRRLWNLTIDDERLREIGLGLGADVPACIHGQPLRMRGIGERLDPVRGLPDIPLLLVNPGRALPTADVFRSLRIAGTAAPRAPMPVGAGVTRLAVWLASSRNDLEEAAIARQPVIHSILEELRALPGALLARMSGSGATCFGLFATPEATREAARTLAATRPDWWIAPTTIPADAPPNRSAPWENRPDTDPSDCHPRREPLFRRPRWGVAKR